MSSYLALKLGYINKTFTKGSPKRFISSLSDYYRTVSPIYLEETKFLSFSRTVNQLIMRFHKPRVEYKLALQEKPQGSNLDALLGTLRTRTRRSLKTPKPRTARGKNAVTSRGKNKVTDANATTEAELNSAKHIFVL